LWRPRGTGFLASGPDSIGQPGVTKLSYALIQAGLTAPLRLAPFPPTLESLPLRTSITAGTSHNPRWRSLAWDPRVRAHASHAIKPTPTGVTRPPAPTGRAAEAADLVVHRGLGMAARSCLARTALAQRYRVGRGAHAADGAGPFQDRCFRPDTPGLRSGEMGTESDDI